MSYGRVASVVLLSSLTSAVIAADLDVKVDARDIVRKRAHVHLSLAAKPGPLTLVYPKWIPGEHGPTGPLESIIGLSIRAGNDVLAWTRDPYDMYQIRIMVPRGASRLEIDLESGLATGGEGFSAAPTSSAQLAILPWNQFLLYPRGTDGSKFSTAASIVAPPAWTVVSALEAKQSGDTYAFETATIERLIDSPVQLGRYAKRFELGGFAPAPAIKHVLSVMADSPGALEVPEDFARGYERLVAENGALFGSRMYRHYTWLLSLSDHVAHFGLEHHESSDNRREEDALSDPDRRMGVAGLLGHEYVHSWNGKYRRPKGLVSPDYEQPMDGSLLWVYEGMTDFWANILPVRAKLVTPEFMREGLAIQTANYLIQPGARWRPLADTAVAAQVLFESPGQWGTSRRGTDFYSASTYLWLDVDAELRAKSGGKLSIDDFVKRFYAGTSGAPQLQPYVEQDLYDALNATAPSDWRKLIRGHLDVTGANQIAAAMERAGWKLTYTGEKNTALELSQKRSKSIDRRWSIGLRLNEEAVVMDTIEDGPAARAGIGPSMKLTAVNGRKYTSEVLDAAIGDALKTRKPIAILVETDDYFRTFEVAYFDGQRFPHLIRNDARPDTLSLLIAPRVE
jgi:predicted metalloprotease with PDZ domain